MNREYANSGPRARGISCPEDNGPWKASLCDTELGGVACSQTIIFTLEIAQRLDSCHLCRIPSPSLHKYTEYNSTRRYILSGPLSLRRGLPARPRRQTRRWAAGSVPGDPERRAGNSRPAPVRRGPDSVNRTLERGERLRGGDGGERRAAYVFMLCWRARNRIMRVGAGEKGASKGHREASHACSLHYVMLAATWPWL